MASNDQLAFSIKQFCKAHGLSRGMFYKLLKDGIAPRVMRVGSRSLVSWEAAADWRRERERAFSI